MRIAFDVKGTLEGHSQEKVRLFLKLLEQAGHEITVWSNMPNFAKNYVQKHDLNCNYMGKLTKSDVGNEEEHYFDVAVEDDRRQTWLAAKRIIFVNEIPETKEEILLKFRDLIQPN